jgi:glycosyltransferase involved in cell wall biosynthesis
MSNTLTIIIPAYNEAQAITPVLEELKQTFADIAHEIVVVDDASQDGTAQAAESAGVRVLRHAHNRGYGAALKTGIRHAESAFVLIMDADGQHRPQDAMNLWQQRDIHEMVVGQRTALLHSPLWRMPGKWVLGRLANYIVERPIPDLNSGMRVMNRQVALKYMHLCPNGFSFTTTITIALLVQGYPVKYVPIQVQPRRGSPSTVSLSTGFRTIMLIIRLAALFAPLRVFLPLSFISAVVGIGWGIPFALSGNGVSVGAMLAIVTAVLLFALGVICDQISQLRLERYE